MWNRGHERYRRRATGSLSPAHQRYQHREKDGRACGGGQPRASAHATGGWVLPRSGTRPADVFISKLYRYALLCISIVSSATLIRYPTQHTGVRSLYNAEVQLRDTPKEPTENHHKKKRDISENRDVCNIKIVTLGFLEKKNV